MVVQQLDAVEVGVAAGQLDHNQAGQLRVFAKRPSTGLEAQCRGFQSSPALHGLLEGTAAVVTCLIGKDPGKGRRLSPVEPEGLRSYPY
jgi:hypothetical protein